MIRSSRQPPSRSRALNAKTYPSRRGLTSARSSGSHSEVSVIKRPNDKGICVEAPMGRARGWTLMTSKGVALHESVRTARSATDLKRALTLDLSETDREAALEEGFGR